MKLTTGTNNPDIDTLAELIALIAHSQIVVAAPKGQGVAKCQSLPAGFGDIDVAVLEWIAAEGRRLGRGFVRH
jgi:hypothetical protein